jgi:hypothetical protein
MTDLELLSQRLARVENRFRWMTRAAVMLALIVAGGVATGQGIQELRQLEKAQGQQVNLPKPLIEEQVRARHFVLVDERGRERASLVADNAGSVFLVMFDGTGKTRANLSVTNDGPSLVLYDAGAQQRTIIGSTTLVGSHVNENGIAEKAPPSSIVLFDKSGKLLWRQP